MDIIYWTILSRLFSIKIKNEKIKNPVVKFNSGLIKFSVVITITIGVLMFIISCRTIFSFFNKGTDAENINMLGILIVFLVVFLVALYCSLFLINKIIIINDDKITYKSLFKKRFTFTFFDIDKVFDFPGKKIKLSLKSKQNISVDYQMDNVITFIDILKSHGIKIINKSGKEIW